MKVPLENIAPSYDHTSFEDDIYRLWEDGSYFSSDANVGPHTQRSASTAQEDAPYTIVMPPPNVTGHLHMGHGLNISIQDALIRYHRMNGKVCLWIPGTDHAGIATQHVVEKRLLDRKIRKEEIGREQFLKESFKVKTEHHAVITKQIKTMGASCDWSVEAFTMDDARSKAVMTAFCDLYDKGMLYRGNYLVNWCTRCKTAVSDEEVEHRTVDGHLYEISYPLADSTHAIKVQTTRPETMLGDVAIAVHPDDPRYTKLVGSKAMLPLVGKHIPIIVDTYINMEFGSGALKVTPAHDPNDFEIGKRHSLPSVSIFTEDGRLNEQVPEQYRGITIAEARQQIIADLRTQKFLTSVTEHAHQVGHCYRCGTVIEPRVSYQWFVKMQPMAQQVLTEWKKGAFRITPKRWEATFEHWLVNIKDWCISRQLWWGHRIPVWYRIAEDGTKQIAYVGTTKPNIDDYQNTLVQDEDVLDTWFSSWLWPLSTLGWPEKGKMFKQYYPTSALISGYDIIFFWISRMLMAGLQFTDTIPFTDIYLTGLIRDKQGRKMSKSLGNGIDPLEVSKKYGTDSLKFSLLYLMSGGQDILLGYNDFAIGTRFCNKLWNAARFIIQQSNQATPVTIDDRLLNSIDKWMGHSLHQSIGRIHACMAEHKYSEAVHELYELTWNSFCDWYIECTKMSIRDQHVDRNHQVSLLIYYFYVLLKLAHPFLSFITEKMYQTLKPVLKVILGSEHTPSALIIADYPSTDAFHTYADEYAHFTELQHIVTAIRSARSNYSIAHTVELTVHIVCTDEHHSGFLNDHRSLIGNLSQAHIDIVHNPPQQQYISIATPTSTIYLLVSQYIDSLALIEKHTKELHNCMARQKSLEQRLAPGSKFTSQAPAKTVTLEQERLKQLNAHITKIQEIISSLHSLKQTNNQ